MTISYGASRKEKKEPPWLAGRPAYPKINFGKLFLILEPLSKPFGLLIKIKKLAGITSEFFYLRISCLDYSINHQG
jgi:hypothetical protein